MRVIVGLGNPGKRYENTRHNIGYRVVSKLAEKHSLEFIKASSNYLLSKGKLEEKFYLLLPLIYMNLSGRAIKEFKNSNEFQLDNLLVICDDINLPLGKLRLRSKGSHGGHNGLLSVINELDSTNFLRLRIGIGKKFKQSEQVDYVLSDFSSDELDMVDKAIDTSMEICDKFILGGFKLAVEYYSQISKILNSKHSQSEEIS